MKLEEWHLGEGDGIQERQLAAEYLPVLEAHRQDDEPDRIERLRRVYAMAQTLFLMVEGRRLPPRIIVAMNDHKGQLAVTFLDREWQTFIEPFFRLAWRSEGEPAEKVVTSVIQ
ncbi:hypothetical protein E3C22_23980 [Jiella endophytica]|uniref:Uncharacterized protein n=1 Tax=Jiella endophytica TaxID=2558362 RepID=A0A4Y8R924_9HYPH|nr:hypothetical protein [Jiella endophytica]TFF17579.1 hypothetical protein E3C22_23980 [Jiella endophytica]